MSNISKFIFLSILGCTTSCGTINTMNRLVDESTTSIYANMEAVQSDTVAIEQNAQTVTASTSTIMENKRLIDESTRLIRANREAIRASSQAIQENKRVIEQASKG